MRILTRIIHALATGGPQHASEFTAALMVERALEGKPITNQVWLGVLSLGTEQATQILPADWVPSKEVWTATSGEALELLLQKYPQHFRLEFWSEEMVLRLLPTFQKHIPILSADHMKRVDPKSRRFTEPRIVKWIAQSPAWTEYQAAITMLGSSELITKYARAGILSLFPDDSLLRMIHYASDTFGCEEAVRLIYAHLKGTGRLKSPTQDDPAIKEMLNTVDSANSNSYVRTDKLQAYYRVFPEDFMAYVTGTKFENHSPILRFVAQEVAMTRELPEELERQLFSSPYCRGDLMRAKYKWRFVSVMQPDATTDAPKDATFCEELATLMAQDGGCMDLTNYLEKLPADQWVAACRFTRSTPDKTVLWAINHAPTEAIREELISAAISTQDTWVIRDILTKYTLSKQQLRCICDEKILTWMHDPMRKENAEGLLALLEPGEDSDEVSRYFLEIFWRVTKPTFEQTIEAISAGAQRVKVNHFNLQQIEELYQFATLVKSEECAHHLGNALQGRKDAIASRKTKRVCKKAEQPETAAV